MPQTSAVLNELLDDHCRELPFGTPPLASDEIKKLLEAVLGWSLANGELTRIFPFKNYYETIAFVNALAWIAHHENHHPDLEVGYNKCTVRYSTHSVGGLSKNDFICAAKVSRLFPASTEL